MGARRLRGRSRAAVGLVALAGSAGPVGGFQMPRFGRFGGPSCGLLRVGRRALESSSEEEKDESRARMEEWAAAQESGGGAEAADAFAELYGRISTLKAAEELLDRTSALNWRRGEMGELAVVELEDTRVCCTRLNGDTIAFGTAAGVVVLVDVDEGFVLDGFDAHTAEVSALEWAGDRLISGGADGAVVVYSPSTEGERQWLFDAADEDDEADDFDFVVDVADDDEAELIEGLYEPLDDLALDGDGDAFLARSRILDGLFERADPEGIITTFEERDIVGELMAHAASLEEGLTDSSPGDPDVILRGHSSRVTGVKAIDDGQRVVSAALDGRLLLWDIRDQANPTAHTIATARSAICCLAVAGAVAVVGLMDGSVFGYDVRDGQVLFQIDDAHDGAVRALHYEAGQNAHDDARGRLLCTGGADGLVTCYTMQESQDGSLKPAPPSRSLQVEEVREAQGDVAAKYRERRCGCHKLAGHSGAVVAVQADDTKLVSASIDGSLRCWDLKTGDQLFALEGHSRHINSLHFQGDLLVSDGTQGTVVVHDFSGRHR